MRLLFLSAFALYCLGLGSATAQEKIKAPVGGPLPPTVIVTPGHGPACDAACCTKKVCIPETTTKKITKTVYSSKCVDFCVLGCTFPKLFHRPCDACGNVEPCATCDKCGKVRTRRVLLKKRVECGEECVTKCTVAEVPVPPAPVCAPTCHSNGLLQMMSQRKASSSVCETVYPVTHPPVPAPAAKMPYAGTSATPAPVGPGLSLAPVAAPPLEIVRPLP